jgi:hypothetical protein
MWQIFPQQTINMRSQYRTQNHNNNHHKTIADQRVHRARTSTRQSLTKKYTAKKIARNTKFF